MTARAPLRLTDSNNNLIEMTSTEITAQLNHAMNLYAGSPSVTLSKVSGSGTLASMTDTRTAAGAVSNSSPLPLLLKVQHKNHKQLLLHMI